VANTLNLFRNGAVGFIDWLDRFRMQLPPNKKPAEDAENDEKRDLPEQNLLKSIGKWLKKVQSKPNCRERADCDTPRDSYAPPTTPQTDSEKEERETECEVSNRCAEPVTTPVIRLQSHHGAAATENLPACESAV